ncbi:phosphate acyltransferase PlsX [Mycoplasmopsis opalescens]|uniref:phosphate acyltransferase PlsX n=1 Tax=Mycoplasmopsis opalescens TaxID=114886 RepID=UPI0004A72B14|nr:phosphate acyltransferase PlsX [Mycoplasmopsis opalescens]
MYRIAFDINGNDNGIKPAIESSMIFAKENPNFTLILVGIESEIYSCEAFNKSLKNIKIINNPNVPTNVKNLRQSLHEDTSMSQAIELVKNNEADAVLSCGDSGTYLALCSFKLKRLPNISRAAFMPVVPAINGKKWLMCDVGANIETTSDYLVEWAIIARLFAKKLLNIDNPKISLINIGSEDYKGSETTRKAHQKLLAIKNNRNDFNYSGFAEPRELMRGQTDVAIIDGYGGNLVLKSLEGALLAFKDLLKEKIMLKTMRKLGYLMMKGAFKDVAETLDYRNVGAAWVIGVNGVAIKSHGSSDSKALLGAYKQIKIALESNVLEQIKDEVHKINISCEEEF